MNASDYLIVIEPTNTGFSAYSPDLDGCITVGETVEQTKSNMEEAIELYLEELQEAGMNLPLPSNLKDQINSIGDLQSGTFIAFVPNHHMPAKSA
jgi:predicted RNase H-like HicB family nuclease